MNTTMNTTMNMHAHHPSMLPAVPTQKESGSAPPPTDAEHGNQEKLHASRGHAESHDLDSGRREG